MLHDYPQEASDERLAKLLLPTVSSEEELRQRLTESQVGINTGYIFGDPNNPERSEILQIQTGITLVSAPTTHGKSTLLQNIMLQIAETLKDAGENGQQVPDSVLYFSFEETTEDIIAQVLTKSINLKLSENSKRTLLYNITTGNTTYFSKERDFSIEDFYKRKKAALNLITSGKIKIFYVDYDTDTLIEAITFINENIPIKAVFLDYLQSLHIKDYRRERREELRDICDKLLRLSLKLKIPIIAASQFNRDTKTPADLHSQNQQDSADIERFARTIVGMWNSNFKARDKIYNPATQDGILKDFNLGTDGHIYMKLLKYRGGIVNLDTIVNFHSSIGIIEPNHFNYGSNTELPDKLFDIEDNNDNNEFLSTDL